MVESQAVRLIMICAPRLIVFLVRRLSATWTEDAHFSLISDQALRFDYWTLVLLKRARVSLSALLLARGWKDSLPIVLHADHGPAVLLRLGHERITDTQHSFLLLDLGPIGIVNRDV